MVCGLVRDITQPSGVRPTLQRPGGHMIMRMCEKSCALSAQSVCDLFC